MAAKPQALKTYCQVPIKKVSLKKTDQITSYLAICPVNTLYASMNMWAVCFSFRWNACLLHLSQQGPCLLESRRLAWACGCHSSPLGCTVNTSVNEWALSDSTGIVFSTPPFPACHVLFHNMEHLVRTSSSQSKRICQCSDLESHFDLWPLSRFIITTTGYPEPLCRCQRPHPN